MKPSALSLSKDSSKAKICSSLKSALRNAIGDAEQAKTAIERLTLYRHVAPTEPAATRYDPSIALVVQGRKRVDLGMNTFLYDETQFLLTSLSLPVVSQVVHGSQAVPYLCMRLSFDMTMVREILAGNEFPSSSFSGTHPAMTMGNASENLLSAFNRLLAVLETPEDVPYLSGLIEREIVYRLLSQPEGQRLRAIATAGDNSQRTAKAVAWITVNFAKPLRVEHLAELAGMGVSTLHHHFRTLTAMSPLQYQKKLRLHTARRLMLSDGLDAASAAFEVGYESASQFNREYSRLFGQSPMRDIRAMLTDSREASKLANYIAEGMM